MIRLLATVGFLAHDREESSSFRPENRLCSLERKNMFMPSALEETAHLLGVPSNREGVRNMQLVMIQIKLIRNER